MARNRWELEENRKKKEQEKARQSIQNAAKTQRQAWQEGAATRRKANSSSGSTGNSAARTGTTTASTQKSGLSGLRNMDSFNQQLTQNATTRREAELAGGAARRRTNIDSRTGTNLSRYNQDMAQLQENQIRWHTTDDPAERKRLNEENNAIRQRRGLSYDAHTGVTYDSETGRNYSAPTQAVFGSTAMDRIRNANNWRQSREFFGMDEDDTTMLPTVRQIQQSGSVEAARGVNAHQVLNELYSRGAETWTDTDTVARDQAVQALSDEMKMILEQYGLQYNARETGPNARFFVSDSEAIERLRQAGADETTIAYVQENINQREAADRLGQGAEAVIKRAVGSIPALFETGQQQAANVEESRQNPEFVQLEQEERQLESQLTSMPSTNYDGSLNQDYLEIYNRLQSVRERKNQLAVNTPVDQSRWGQTMLREAAEAQTNATAGLSAVPRFLANTGISIAGNAPVMATSLIPGAGPAVGAALIGASAAGQRAQELSAAGAAPSEALGRGTLSGIIEAVTEKLPLDTLADILQRGGTGAVRSILRQMGVEAGEESASYLMNYAADLAAADPNAQFSFAELAQNALGGAISGGVFGAAGTLGGRARTGAQTAQEEAAATRAGNNAPMAQETTQDIQTPVQSSPQMTSLEARAAAARARNAPLQVSAWPEGARRPRLEGGEEFLDDAAIPESDFRADSQALGRRLAELDEQRRTAENLLPGPARDARIAEIEAEMEQVRSTAPVQTTMRDFQQRRQAQAAKDFAAAGEPVQAEQPAAPEVNVPVSEAVQYGATPQQAMREAEVRAQGEAAQEAARSEREETVSGLMQAWTDKRAAEKQAEQTLAGLTLTQHDIDMAQNAARTGVSSQEWAEADNPEKARLYGSVLRAVREADQPIRQYFAQRATAMQSEAQHAADAIATYAKDKRFGGQYQRETMERNIRDIFGKDHQTEAEAIISEYITPVHKAVADGNKLKNSMRERVKALKLNKHERALVQMRLEAEDGAAAEYIENNKIKVTPKMDAKISRAVEEFRSIYNELYNRINETLLLNGQEPAPFRKNYAPHFTKDKPDTLLGRIRFALGLGKDSSLNIPTDIAGLTDTFRPGKKWFGNLLQREGEITDYDAVAGFDQYIENAADVITLTESIQKLRALEDQVRYTLSDEGVQAQIDAIRANPELDALQQREQMEKVYDTNRTTVQQLIDDLRNQQRMGMGRFVTELRRYTDNLAGKKSREDRGWEDMANRQVYQLAKSLEGRVAANMISLNPGSWLTNIIPITQATGEVSVPNLVRGMYQTVKANIKDDGYRDASAFLTNRYGSESIDKTIGRRVSDLSGAPMELIDHFTANTIHRARYAQNIDRGMSMDEAIDDADAYTASLMADRSKGALPTAFNATNPIRKVFTMFQTEVNNQLSYLFKDMPRAQRQKGVAAVAWAYTKVFGTAYLFNLAYSQLTGRDSAFDPIGMIADALGVGDDEDDERTVAERLTGLAEDIGGNIPFVGGIVFDGGRVPISSAFPDFINLGKAVLPSGWTGVEWSGDKRAQTALKEIAKPLTYLVPPFGGGAAKRAIEGFATVNAGGSYTYDNEGNRTLQFPTYGQTPLDYARAMLFGKWSSEEAQEYIDNGFKGLSADETAVFDQLRNSMGLDARQAMDTILGLRGYETVRDEDGNILQTVKDQQRLALFDNDNLTPEQKAAIDRALIVSGEDEQPADYTDRNAFLIGQYVSESRQDAAREAISHGLDIDQFVQWDDRLRELENEKGADDKAVRSAAEARVMLLDEVMQDGALSDGEKQTIADYIVISSMGDSQREDWESIAKGKVSASDYVQFVGDVSAYKEEYKNTGADNSANVAEILRGYDGLTDAQRDVLFQTYSSTMKNNPFHVSEYEQRMQDNQFYQDLNEAGRAEVRALANEYEQDINEDNELSDWEGKAYMAQEAGISPETYILYRVALATANADGKGSAKQSEAETAVNLIPGLTQQQKAYLYQSTNTSWKNNPFGSATVTKYNAETTEAINPVEGGRLSSSFGPRSSPTAGASSWHKAIDIAADEGTPVRSVMPGTVVSVNKSGFGGGYGVSVRVDHGNGVVTEYHHMQEGSVDNINVGDTVEAGQQIGRVGSTGISTGPHLDMQAWKDGQIVDPLTIIPGYGDPSGYVYDGTVSSGVVSSGSSGSSSGSSGKSSGSGSNKSSGNGLSKLKGLSGLKRLG